MYMESIGDCDSKEKLIDVSTLKISRLNRTTFQFKGGIKIVRDMPSDAMVNFVYYFILVVIIYWFNNNHNN